MLSADQIAKLDNLTPPAGDYHNEAQILSTTTHPDPRWGHQRAQVCRVGCSDAFSSGTRSFVTRDGVGNELWRMRGRML
jgi:hypothetical protein